MDDRIIRARIETLRQRALVSSHPIRGWEARTAVHGGPSVYSFDGDWAAAAEPSAWAAGRTLFLRGEASFPRAADGQRVWLRFDARLLEGLLSVDGRPWAGVDPEHLRVPGPPPGRRVLEAEFTCVPAAFHAAAARGETALVRSVHIDCVTTGMEALAWDAQFAWEACRAVRDARRRSLVQSALEQALLLLDLAGPDAELRDQAAAARALLGGLLGTIGSDPEEGRIFLTGHSHIDTAWLWPLRETIRKCGRTFATASRLMELYPDYRFSCSQPQLYAYTRKHYPALYEEIRGWVAAGRWECTGGMWVEADCNIPSGESLIRQVLHGLAFFRQEFGKRPRTCWLPDVFGYPGSLPGILAGCGISGFYTNKLHWQARNPFPAHLFRWEGIDGRSVVAHIPRLPEYYNGFPNPAQLRAAWDDFNEKGLYQEMMFPFGHGDGGGGPTVGMLEFAQRARAFPGLPACRQGLEEEWFDDVNAAGVAGAGGPAPASGPVLPAWVGELYLETHRGTYTTQSSIKKSNRANELALREAEIWSCVAQIMEQEPGDGGAAKSAGREAAPGSVHDPLREAWEALLLHQFHDILPGSSIGEVYREARAVHASIAETAAAVRQSALGRLAGAGSVATGPAGAASAPSGSFVLFNSLSWDRGDPVELPIPDLGPTVEAVMPDGRTVPAQVASPEGRVGGRVVFVPPVMPGVGSCVVTVRKAAPAAARVAASREPDGSMRIESPLYSIRLDADGTITRLQDKRNAREVVPAGLRANELQLFQDGPEMESAWNVHEVFEKRRYPWDGPAVIRVLEQGPVRAAVRVTLTRRESSIEQDLVVWADHPRIDFVTRAAWQERQVLLKAAFPVAVRSESAAFEVQFGAVRRPTHRNTSWDQEKFEVCAHKWMDLSEPGYGASVLNDSRYGCDVHGSVMRLTLLRGAEWPDPDADRGMHELVYSLFPHAGDWTDAGTVRRAWELNVPVTAVPVTTVPVAAAGARASTVPPTARFFSVDGPGILEALKKAEDGRGLVLRFYEPHGARGTVRVIAPRDITVVEECNHVEEGGTPWAHESAAFSFPLLPFQVRTFRVCF